MMKSTETFFAIALFSLWMTIPGRQIALAQTPVSAIPNPTSAQLKNLVTLYEELHRNPELSFQEEKTSTLFANELKAMGYEVTTKIGGFGVVGILKKGAGPTVLLRTDLDALPLTETTALPYASKLKVKTKDGSEVGVMHACGHDFHITNLLGVARQLIEQKTRWSGTLMILGQPAEEKGAGAMAMIKDGLFKKFPKPQFALALHADASQPVGTATLIPGPLTASVDSIDITLRGRGGHGARPQDTIDPITMGSELVIALQQLISREKDPMAPAVLTVGSFHAGTKHNIIPETAKLEMTLRTFSKEVRTRLLKGIQRKASALARSYGAPEPEIKQSEDPVPSVINDPQLVERLRPVFQSVLGSQKVLGGTPWTVGEDFSRYGAEGIPSLMFSVGTITEKRFLQYQRQGQLPSLHSPNFFPSIEEVLKVSIPLMTESAIELLKQ